MKFLLIAAISIASVIILALVAPFLIPSATYRNWVERRVAAVADAHILIEKFRFRILPYPGYTIEGFALVSTKPPFQGLPLIRAENVTGSLSFADLVRGRIVTEVVATGVTADYRIAAGVTNLDMMFGWADENAAAAARAHVIETLPAIGAAPGPQGAPAAPAADVSTMRVMPGPAAEAPPPAPTAIPMPPPTPSPGTAPRTPTPPPPPTKSDASPHSSIRKIFEREAMAAEDTNAADDGAGIEITSLDVRGAKLNIFDEGATIFYADSIDIFAKDLSGGPEGGGDIRVSGAVMGSAEPNASAEGRLLFNPAAHEIAAKEMKVYLGDVQLTADATLGYGTTPAVFDVHLATAELSRESVAPFLAPLGVSIPPSLAWKGPIAADATLKGTRAEFEIDAQIDATRASIALAPSFFKGPGLSAKAGLTLVMTPANIAVRRADVLLGKYAFAIQGDLGRGEAGTVHLAISASGLDAAELKSCFPALYPLESMTGLKIAADLEGRPGSTAPLTVEGNFKADAAKAAGMEITGIDGTFVRLSAGESPAQGETAQARAAREGGPACAAKPAGLCDENGILFPTIGGTFAGGQFSGNGSVIFGDQTKYHFDAVVEHAIAKDIPAAGGALDGEASMVVRVESSGPDPFSLEGNLKISGSLVVPVGKWAVAKPAAVIFSAGTWSALESAGRTTLAPAAEAKLAQADETFEKLNASFELSDMRLDITDLAWYNPQYEAKVKGSIDRTRAVRGDGAFIIPKDQSAQLVAQEPGRKALLDEKGRLSLPVTIGGSAPAIEIGLDGAKLASLAGERTAPPAPTGIPANIVREGETKPPAPAAAAATAKPAEGPAAETKPVEKPAAAATEETPKTKPAPKKKAPIAMAPKSEEEAKPASGQKPEAAPKPQKQKKTPPEPMQEPEDVLKVIIGQ